MASTFPARSSFGEDATDLTPLQRELLRLREAARLAPLADTSSEARRLERLSERPPVLPTPAPAARAPSLAPTVTGPADGPAPELADLDLPPLSSLRHRAPPADLSAALKTLEFGEPLPREPLQASRSPEGTLGADAEPVRYHAYQHATWKRLLALQAELTLGRCAPEYAAGRGELDAFAERISTLPEIDRWLRGRTGWRIVRADGYVSPKRFFGMLAQRTFPCMDQIRHEEEVLYSPAPDMYHDIVGHMPMLQNARFAEYYEVFGHAGLRARHDEQIEALNRIYWYTMEFGLVEASGSVVPYGAALLTGLAELLTAKGNEVARRPFDLATVIASPTDVQRPNDVLFVTGSYDALFGAFVDWARSEHLL